MPELPTLAESGLPGYDRSSWQGVLAPAGVPGEIIARLNAAIVTVVHGPELKEAFRREGLEPHTMTPQQFAAHISSETARNAQLLQGDAVRPTAFDAGTLTIDALKGKNEGMLGKLRLAMLVNGVDLKRWRGGIVSVAHTQADVDLTLEAWRKSLRALKEEGEL